MFRFKQESCRHVKKHRPEFCGLYKGAAYVLFYYRFLKNKADAAYIGVRFIVRKVRYIHLRVVLVAVSRDTVSHCVNSI